MSFYIRGKGYFEESGKPIGSKRKVDLMLARSYGASGNSEAFTRLYCESRTGRQALMDAYRSGQPKQEVAPRPRSPELDERHARMMAHMALIPKKDPNL